MILIVGGIGAGKRAFAEKALGMRAQRLLDAQSEQAPCVYGLEEALREQPDRDWAGELAGKRAVICDEVGSGVVPADAAERAWRERVGRTCCELAARANVVVRVCCGIPQVVKGELCE